MDQIASTEYLSIFKNKRVMLTGHTGFKGSWLAFLLNKIGAEVLGYALPPIEKENHFNLLELDKLILSLLLADFLQILNLHLSLS